MIRSHCAGVLEQNDIKREFLKDGVRKISHYVLEDIQVYQKHDMLRICRCLNRVSCIFINV